MSSSVVIEVSGLSKHYPIFAKPQDRLKQAILPRLSRLFGRPPKCYFREFRALDGVSFQVAKGETVGVIGRNGSGKSTLLQIICNTLSPSAGQMRTTGRVAALLELGSGFNPEFSGRENVYLNAALLGLTKAEVDARYDQIVAFADIGDFIDQPTKTYSSGMMVRLAFSVIAHVDADVLVVDEALAVGDAYFTQKCMRFLRNFMKHGTVLFVSHDTSAVRSLCNRAIWLEKGKVVQDGDPKEVSEAYLEALYASQQGESVGPVAFSARPTASTAGVSIVRDQRDNFINHSNLRNDLQVFKFDPDAEAFGKGGASISDVRLTDLENATLGWVVGGEQVNLRIDVWVQRALSSPIIGFYVKDKLGQALFGDNTYLSYCDSPVATRPGQTLVAEFQFQMPRLAPGDYSITVAIADGTQSEHVQHHWIHDAIVFRSENSSVSSGIFGVPMMRIQLDVNYPE